MKDVDHVKARAREVLAAASEGATATPGLVSTLLEALEAAESERDRLRAKHVAFTDHLGFGDDRTEPAAELDEIVERIEQAFSIERDHFDCPIGCEQCGETLARTVCEHCHGSGADNTLCENSGAYSECEWCAGAGKVHEGCMGASYTDLVAENTRLRAVITAVEETLPTKLERGVQAVPVEFLQRALRGVHQ